MVEKKIIELRWPGNTVYSHLHIVLFLIAFVADVNIIIDFTIVAGRAVMMCQIVSLAIWMVGILIVWLMAR